MGDRLSGLEVQFTTTPTTITTTTTTTPYRV